MAILMIVSTSDDLTDGFEFEFVEFATKEAAEAAGDRLIHNPPSDGRWDARVIEVVAPEDSGVARHL